MEILRTAEEVGFYRRKYSDIKLGFVPTMGALHDGHLSLIEVAKEQCDKVVASIFINPTQFDNSEDFDKYPKTTDEDIAALLSVGCDALFIPENSDEIYQHEVYFDRNIGDVLVQMEGSFRKGHFDGVMRVVKLLFDIVKPNSAFFGLKDYQQYAVIKKMVAHLNLPIAIIGCETVRETSGLAMSSRNRRLTPDQLKRAVVLFETLQFAKSRISFVDINDLEQICLEKLKNHCEPEYFCIRNTDNLEKVDSITPDLRLRAFVAARVGNVRLIDNLLIS